jgi:hypothetical protein
VVHRAPNRKKTSDALFTDVEAGMTLQRSPIGGDAFSSFIVARVSLSCGVWQFSAHRNPKYQSA